MTDPRATTSNQPVPPSRGGADAVPAPTRAGLTLVPSLPTPPLDDDAMVVSDFLDSTIQVEASKARDAAHELAHAGAVARGPLDAGPALMMLAAERDFVAAATLRRLYPDLLTVTSPDHPDVTEAVTYLERRAAAALLALDLVAPIGGGS